MTGQQAVKYIQYVIDNSIDSNTKETGKVYDALYMALAALEKQIPEKPEATINHHLCAKCGRQINDEGAQKFRYCPNCGQAIDWTEDEE